MVPGTFTPEEVSKGRKFVLSRVSNVVLHRDGTWRGDPFVTYKELVEHLGYSIEDEFDGDRAGVIAGQISRMEYKKTRIMLSALVVTVDTKRVGHGFYSLAGEFNLIRKKDHYDVNGLEELSMWNQQLNKCVRKYAKRSNRERRQNIHV